MVPIVPIGDVRAYMSASQSEQIFYVCPAVGATRRDESSEYSMGSTLVLRLGLHCMSSRGYVKFDRDPKHACLIPPSRSGSASIWLDLRRLEGAHPARGRISTRAPGSARPGLHGWTTRCREATHWRTDWSLSSDACSAMSEVVSSSASRRRSCAPRRRQRRGRVRSRRPSNTDRRGR